MPAPLVTVVCPVFNEERSIAPFYRRLCEAIKPIADKVQFEFLFVNNRSTDGTLQALQELKKVDERVKVITMSRNFGYQASITAGMRHARGDAIVNIDVDCEDPPEMIPQFVEKWLGGADIAYGIRTQRAEFILMHLARKLFYRLTRGIADHEIVLDMAEFFLLDRRVRDAVLATRSTFPFVRGQAGYVGFRRQGIPYRRERRQVGKSHYNILNAIKFGVAGILSSSTLPLRMLWYVGFVAFAADVVIAISFLTGSHRFELPPLPWWLLAAALFHAGWVMLALGTLGIYLARIYKDGIGLPLYVIDERASDVGHTLDATLTNLGPPSSRDSAPSTRDLSQHPGEP